MEEPLANEVAHVDNTRITSTCLIIKHWTSNANFIVTCWAIFSQPVYQFITASSSLA